MKKLISIIIPAYNEEKTLPLLYRRLLLLMKKHSKYDFEIIIIENGSYDNTYHVLKKIRDKDKRFKIIQLSRNFNPVGGQRAGLMHAKGDAAVLMFADLQDPPEIISQFLKEWEKGNEIVYGVITKRNGVSLIRKIISPIFYSIVNFLTEGKLPKNATDFRLMDKKVYTQINKMQEHNQYIRGLDIWTGFKQKGVPYVRAARVARGGGAGGADDFNLVKFLYNTISFMSDGVFSYSTLPLKLISLSGILISFITFLSSIYLIIFHILHGTSHPGYVRGYTSSLLITLFLFGVMFFFMGILGEYIARIYDEVKNRPNYIIREKLGFS